MCLVPKQKSFSLIAGAPISESAEVGSLRAGAVCPLRGVFTSLSHSSLCIKWGSQNIKQSFQNFAEIGLTLFAQIRENLQGSLIFFFFELKMVGILIFTQRGLGKTPWQPRGPHRTVCQAKGEHLALVSSRPPQHTHPAGTMAPSPQSAPPSVG